MKNMEVYIEYWSKLGRPKSSVINDYAFKFQLGEFCNLRNGIGRVLIACVVVGMNLDSPSLSAIIINMRILHIGIEIQHTS